MSSSPQLSGDTPESQKAATAHDTPAQPKAAHERDLGQINLPPIGNSFVFEPDRGGCFGHIPNEQREKLIEELLIV